MKDMYDSGRKKIKKINFIVVKFTCEHINNLVNIYCDYIAS